MTEYGRSVVSMSRTPIVVFSWQAMQLEERHYPNHDFPRPKPADDVDEHATRTKTAISHTPEERLL